MASTYSQGNEENKQFSREKQPVLKLQDLYVKYPNGGELGWFAFVKELKSFAVWNVDTNEWIQSESSDKSSVYALIAEQHKNDALAAKDQSIQAKDESVQNKLLSEQARNEAQQSANMAGDLVIEATEIKNITEEYKILSEQNKDASVSASNDSISAKNASVAAKDIAVLESLKAQTANTQSLANKNAAEASKNAAEAAKVLAETHKNTATQKASEASQSSYNSFQYQEVAKSEADKAIQAAVEALSSKLIANSSALASGLNAEQSRAYKDAALMILRSKIVGSPIHAFQTEADLISANPNKNYIYIVSTGQHAGYWYYFDFFLNEWRPGARYSSATPKGYFLTFSALESAFPSGDDGVYIVGETGHFHFWDGVLWADGGLYQAPLGITQEFGEDETLAVSQKFFSDETGNLINEIGLLQQSIDQINFQMDSKVDGAFSENGLLYLTSNGVVVVGPIEVGVAGSGGSGGGGGSIMRLTTISPTYIVKGASSELDIQFSFLSTDSVTEIPTGNGTAVYYVNSIQKAVVNITQGNNTFNPTQYLTVGNNSVSIRVTDSYGSSRMINYSIEVISLSLTSTFDQKIAYTSAIPFKYTPTGNMEKTIRFYVDDVELNPVVTSLTNKQLTYSIPQQAHGHHVLRVKAEATYSGVSIESNELYYDIICLADGSTQPVITSSYNVPEIGQYKSIVIPFFVYTPGFETSNVVVKDNGTIISTLTAVDRTEQSIEYRADNFGARTIEIISGATTRAITLNVGESIIKFNAETIGLELFLTANGRSNNDLNKSEWKFGTIEAQLTNFDFITNGWVKDSSNNTVLRVSGDANVYIPFEPFATDFRSIGKTIEIEFSTKDILNYELPIIHCYSGERGIQITPNKSTFRSAYSNVQANFKDEERVRISMVVTGESEGRLIYTYINGIISGIKQYAGGDNPDAFNQLVPVGITINGANENIVDVYNIRVYNDNLTTQQVLNNYIADLADIDKKLELYYKNNILNESGQIPYNYLIDEERPYKIPVMILTGQLPPAKGSKRALDIIYIDPISPANNFTMVADKTPGKENSDVQGTSSAVYPRKNYKIKFKNGVVKQNGVTLSKGYYKLRPNSIAANVFTFKADFAESSGTHNTGMAVLAHNILTAMGFYTPPQVSDIRVRTTVDGFPIVIYHRATENDEPYFLGKYNFNTDKDAVENYGFNTTNTAIQSWEFTNNASPLCLFQDNDFYKVIDWVDEATQTPMQGPAWQSAFEVRFAQDEDNPDTTEFKKLFDWFMDCRTTFAPKDFAGTFAQLTLSLDITRDYLILDPADTTYFGHKVAFNQVSNAWEDAGVYAPLSEPVTYGMTTYSYDTENYRIAKFKAEASGHFNMNFLYAYYLITEIFGMTDQRAKNMFLATWGNEGSGEYKWYPTLYDNDTELGIKNTGEIAFDYTIERDSFVNGQYAYNGHSSELWIALEKAFPAELVQTYANMRNILNYQIAYDAFMTLQSDKWSETIYNEDAEFKYVGSLLSGLGNYLANAQGSRADHRKWWLFNRFRFMDSKYGVADFLNDMITVRVNTPDSKRFILDVTNFTAPISYDYRVVIGPAEYNIVDSDITAGAGTISVKLVSGAGAIPETGNFTYKYKDGTTQGVYGFSLFQTILNDLVIQPSNDFQLSTFTPQYARVKYSNLKTTIVKTASNVLTTVVGPSGNVNDFETSIYGASNIRELKSLASKYIGFMDFSKANKLRELIIGDGTAGYINLALGSANDVTVGNMKLLKKIDIQNCPNVRNPIDLSGCSQLEEVYLLGTNVPSVSLSNGGRIQKLELPDVASFVLRNQNMLLDENFVIGTSKMEKIRIENSNGIDILSFVQDCINNSPNLQAIRLTGIDTTGAVQIFLDLRNYLGLDSNSNIVPISVITGEHYVNVIRRDNLAELNDRFPELVISYADLAIVFNDLDTELLALSAFDNDNDGFISDTEAASVLSLGNTFIDQANVNSFDEISYFTGLKEIFLQGTSIPYVKLPNSIIEKLHLPNITKLEIKNQPNLTQANLSYGKTNLQDAIIENSPQLNIMSIMQDFVDNCPALQHIRLIGINTSDTGGNTQLFVTLGSKKGLDANGNETSKPIITGNHFVNIISASWKDYIQTNYPDLVLTYNTISITFADPAVGAIAIANWGSADGILTEAEAAAVTNLGTVFQNNTTITQFNELEFFTGLTSIPVSSFAGCTALTGLPKIPSTVSSIDSYAFYACTGIIGNIVIPNSVTTLEPNAFANLTNSNLGTLTIGTGITSIEVEVFKGSKFKGNINIPSNVTSIKYRAFQNCTELTGLTLNNGITNLLPQAFEGCTNLTGQLIIPTTLTTIGASAFIGTKFTGDLVIPNAVLTIGDDAFRSVGITGQTGTLTFSSSVTAVGYSTFQSSKFTGVLNLSNSTVQSIGTAAFRYCLFSSVSLPSTVTSIDPFAFDGMPNIISMIIHVVTPPTLGSTAVPGTYPIYVPTGSVAAYQAATNWSAYSSRIFGFIPFASQGAFRAAINFGWDTDGNGIITQSELSAITTFPTTATVGGTALDSPSLYFRNNDYMTTFHEMQYMTGLTTIPSGAGSGGFYSCDALTALTLPANLISMGDYTFAFCYLLTSIGTIPAGVTTIGNYFMMSCTSMQVVDLHSGITVIGSNAFLGCTAMVSITVRAVTPPTLGTVAFDNSNNCPIYVPAASVDAYKAATNWSTYASRIFAIV